MSICCAICDGTGWTISTKINPGEEDDRQQRKIQCPLCLQLGRILPERPPLEEIPPSYRRPARAF